MTNVSPGAGGPPSGGADALDREALQQALDQHRLELQECRRRFHNVIERSADGIVITNPEGVVRYVNAAAERLFERTAVELTGQDFGFPLTAEGTTEIDIVRRDGSGRHVAELRVADTEWNGEPARLVSMREVTDRKEAEEQERRVLLERAARQDAERAHRRSRFLAEASAILDASLHVNETLATLARALVPEVAEWCAIAVREDGRSRRVAAVHADTALQRTLEALLESSRIFDWIDGSAPGDPSRTILLADLNEARLDEITGGDGRGRGLRALGTRSVILAPLGRHNERLGTIVLACDRQNFDLDDRELAEEVAARASRAVENARLYQAALAASRAKSDFLAIMSHELRTPLNAIVGYSAMLHDGVIGAVDEEQARALRRIEASAHQLIQVIDGILAHAGLESGRASTSLEDVRLSELVDSVAAVCRPLAHDRGLEFRVDVSPPDVCVQTDAAKVRQIMLNLLLNAVKFTPAGWVALDVRSQTSELRITVRDTGVGIAPEHLERIFEPFWQAEQPHTRHAGGTGLGLTITRRLVELLGGSLTVESSDGNGTTFTCTLPLRSNPAH